jgi:hypothetical protein
VSFRTARRAVKVSARAAGRRTTKAR